MMSVTWYQRRVRRPSGFAMLWQVPWLGLLAIGCGGANHLADGVYRAGEVAFTVPAVPPDWRRIEVSDATLAFRDDRTEASVLVNARCSHLDDDVPLGALTNQLVMGTTERDFVSQDTMPFDGREALHSVLKAKLDGVLLQYDLYVLKKDGCVYDFVYVAPPDAYTQGAPLFERFVAGFHTLPGSGGR
jgi:hypothetical protein